MNTPDYRPFAGPVLDIYGSYELAVRQIENSLGSHHPHIIRFQGWPEGAGPKVRNVRSRWPACQIGLCPGVDPVASRFRSGKSSPAEAAHELVRIADGAADLGIGTLVFDAEAAWKSTSQGTRKQLADIAQNALREIRAKYPRMRIGLTSYGWPVRTRNIGGHTEFPWKGWLDGSVFFCSQNYDRGYGNLFSGEETSTESCDALIRGGLAAPETVRYPEVQLHHNRADEIVRIGMDSQQIHLWAAGSEGLFDEEGSKAYSALTRLWDGGWWNRVRDFQSYKGLKADGIFGRMSLAAALTL